MRVENGYYKKRELEAGKKSVENFTQAVQRRDSKELENNIESAAEGQLSVDAAVKLIDSFDMQAAHKKYHETGDESVFDDYNAAMIALGQPKMDLTNVPTLAINKKG